ncbi:OmpP1/FadL family transporter [Desulfuromonas sp. TF]|uniref:OmpP1/FadL family transporter n=1 Tax=Desulfuromonas sp. TF TaxID=1232410 RepID=UPI00040BABBF|nr:outer membrane protein transport protein [Desulfuromonas sp. TF]
MKAKSAMLVGMLGILAMASPAFSAGFAIIEQSVSGLGNAFAGGAASAEDATTVYFNPAGLTRLKGQQAIAGLHVIVPSAKFEKENASNALGQPISGGNGGDAGETGIVPNFFYSANLDNGWSLGLGVTAPFGLVTEYDKTWVGRYHGVKSDVMTININPSVAYKVNDRLSLGAGVSAQYVDVNLTSMVDFGLAAFQSSGGNPALLPIVSNPDADVYADLTADDWGYGFNLGVLYEFDDDSRIGLAYRSRIDHTVEGEGDFSLQNPAFLSAVGLQAAAQAAFPDQDVKGDITLPASASLSVFHRINPQWAVMADVLWTEWSTFDWLVIEFDGGLADSVTAENWDDSWRYAVGATYSPNEKLDLRLGLAYDETPVPSAKYRTPRIPCEDRIWTSIGVGYQIGERMKIDFAYAHLFVKDSKIDKSTADAENLSRGNLQGEYENEVDIASIQLAYSF